MLKSASSPFKAGSVFVALIVLFLAIAQIISAELLDLLHIGKSVVIQSRETSHPLVPYGLAFAIWGLIYLWSMAYAIWQLGAKARASEALRITAWPMAGMFLVNSLWQLWVPLKGIDWVSFAMIATELYLGVSTLINLSKKTLSLRERLLAYVPLALLTGWITAASFVNFTSALVFSNIVLIDPRHPEVSLGFLMALITFGAVILWQSRSLTYGLTLSWALYFVLKANMVRDHNPDMVMACATGIGLLGIIFISTRFVKPAAKSKP